MVAMVRSYEVLHLQLVNLVMLPDLMDYQIVESLQLVRQQLAITSHGLRGSIENNLPMHTICLCDSGFLMLRLGVMGILCGHSISTEYSKVFKVQVMHMLIIPGTL